MAKYSEDDKNSIHEANQRDISASRPQHRITLSIIIYGHPLDKMNHVKESKSIFSTLLPPRVVSFMNDLLAPTLTSCFKLSSPNDDQRCDTGIEAAANEMCDEVIDSREEDRIQIR